MNKTEPCDADAAEEYYMQGNAFYEKGEFEKAIECYDKAINCSPEGNTHLYRYHYNRGLAYACLERYTKAASDIEKVVELYPEFPEAYYILGLICEYMNVLDTAIFYHKKALQKQPDFPDAKTHLEKCYAKKKQKTTEFQSTKPSQEDHSETLNKVKKLKEQGSHGDALMLLEDTLTKDHDNFKLLLQKRILIDEIRRNKCEVIFGLEDLEDAFDVLVNCPLKHSSHILYQVSIVQSSKGLILYGPPGCGKNLFVRVMAKRAGIKVVEVVLSEVLNMYAGESEKRLTQAFHEAIDLAKTGQPVMLFIDEVDALGFARGMTAGPEEASWSRNLIATFLRLFNEIRDIHNLVIVGATNSFWSIDDALKRPGRLGDSIMYIPPPDEKAREMMLRYFSKDTPGHENVDFKRLAEISRFSSGSELENICKDVHLEIAREIVEHKRPRTKATTEHYEEFIYNKKPTVLSWTRKVGEALEEGRIQFSELDPKLINDIRLARSLDKVFLNKKRRK